MCCLQLLVRCCLPLLHARSAQMLVVVCRGARTSRCTMLYSMMIRPHPGDTDEQLMVSQNRYSLRQIPPPPQLVLWRLK